MYQHKNENKKYFFYTLEFMGSRISVCSENFDEAESSCIICINIINATWLHISLQMYRVLKIVR